MLTNITIREAALSDALPLVELAADTYREAYRHLDDATEIADYVAQAFTPQGFADQLQDPQSVLLVAQAGDGAYLGYAHVAHSTPPPCVTGPAPVELARLYLRQSIVGKGYGSALLEAVHAVARRAQRQTMWLGVYHRNEPARNFYKRWGFEDVGTKGFAFGGRVYNDPVMSAPVPYGD